MSGRRFSHVATNNSQSVTPNERELPPHHHHHHHHEQRRSLPQLHSDIMMDTEETAAVDTHPYPDMRLLHTTIIHSVDYDGVNKSNRKLLEVCISKFYTVCFIFLNRCTKLILSSFPYCTYRISGIYMVV